MSDGSHGTDGTDGTGLEGVLAAMQATWSSIIELAESLTGPEWSLPTRCPGWDVHDQFAHVASLEQMLAGGEVPPEAPAAAHIRNPVGAHMERGVHALRGLSPEELIAVLKAAIAARSAALQANPPQVGDDVRGVMGNPVPAVNALPIRVFDLWVHEQDVRCATGRPGNEDGPGARVGRGLILSMLPRYWAKDAGAQPGQSLRLKVTGGLPFERTVVVGADGRAAIAPEGTPSPDPVTVVELAWADLVARANGRAGADDSPVTITGDERLGRAVLDALPMSP
jgi:uncharacterized protein (TIGR03083 family)